MLREILIAGGLAVVTVAIHGVGFDALLRAIMWSRALARSGVWRVGPLVIGLTCWLVLIHLIEISIWGLFYFWQGWFPDTLRSIFLQAPTRRLAAVSRCPSRGGCSHRLKH